MGDIIDDGRGRSGEETTALVTSMKQRRGMRVSTLVPCLLLAGPHLLYGCACTSSSGAPQDSSHVSSDSNWSSGAPSDSGEQPSAPSSDGVSSPPTTESSSGSMYCCTSEGGSSDGGSFGSTRTSTHGASSSGTSPNSQNLDAGSEPVECGDWACFPIPNAEATPPLPADYDTSNPDVVFDRVTGLMWQTVAAPERIKADAVAGACDDLALAGYSDWRVPRLMELLSLIDHASDAPGGELKTTHAFADDGPYEFWSISQYGTSTGLWLASLSGGYVDAPSAAGSARLRCVRTHEVRAFTADNDTNEHYTASGAGATGTVRDNWTNLEWHAAATGTSYTFAEAADYCTASTVGGGGWRVPNAAELYSLVDLRSSAELKIDTTVFSNTARNTWTSSPSPLQKGSAWFVDFRLAKLNDMVVTGGDLIDEKLSVRCVR